MGVIGTYCKLEADNRILQERSPLAFLLLVYLTIPIPKPKRQLCLFSRHPILYAITNPLVCVTLDFPHRGSQGIAFSSHDKADGRATERMPLITKVLILFVIMMKLVNITLPILVSHACTMSYVSHSYPHRPGLLADVRLMCFALSNVD